MTRRVEIAALHGHPTIAEDNAKIIELRSRYPAWQIERRPRGFEAFHRTETPNPRTRRVGVQTRLLYPDLTALADALLVQQALRGDGPEATQ